MRRTKANTVFAHDLHTGRLVAAGVNRHDIRDVNRAFFFQDAALVILGWLGMTLDHTEALQHNTSLLGLIQVQDAKYPRPLALFLAGDHFNEVAFTNALH